MKDLVILTNNYPSESNIYANGFIHSRVKYYLDEFNVTVLIWTPQGTDTEYLFEGVKVIKKKEQKEIRLLIDKINPATIAIHFVEGWMLNDIIKPFHQPITIWVHGVEALGWYRRLFNHYTLRELAGYIYRNTIQLYQLRKIIKYSNHNPRVKFVFVSEWMKRITETDTMTKIKYFSIIPNPIDNNQFRKSGNKAHLRSKILLIRPFATKKYANDIAINAISKLSESPIFEKLSFEIYGDGVLFDEETKSIVNFENVKLHKRFVPHKEIDKIHNKFGIFLCPTRQDAQGVSMCEAMASGLVVITSDNTAIPEFVTDGESGILTHNSDEIAQAIVELQKNPDKFEDISGNGSKAIIDKAGLNVVIEQEKAILNR